MKPEEINRAVAESMGWKRYHQDGKVILAKPFAEVEKYWFSCGVTLAPDMPIDTARDVPDFFSDLNACQKMEEALSEPEKSYFATSLYHVSVRAADQHSDHYIDWDIAWTLSHATAPQRCEAFLRVKDKWRHQ